MSTPMAAERVATDEEISRWDAALREHGAALKLDPQSLEALFARVRASDRLQSQALTAQRRSLDAQWIEALNERNKARGQLRNVVNAITSLPREQQQTFSKALTEAQAGAATFVEDLRREERERCANIARQNSVLDWVGGSTGNAIGTAKRIVAAILADERTEKGSQQ